ncbi:MAG: NAD-binding protein [Acidimicrobiales bacterium]
MKSLAFVLSYLAGPLRRRDLRMVLILLSIFVALVVTFTVVFHELMAREGQRHSWATGFYWTLVTMTTLGFGDITFTSDLGRVFSVVVLLTGTAFLLILLPFAFIQFVFVPWMNRRDASRAPRSLPEDTRDHLVLTRPGPIEDALIRRAEQAGVDYVLLVPDLADALRLHDEGYRVMVGSSDDPATHRAARVDQAALLAATWPDTTNANVIFTAREISGDVPVVATATKPASIDILELAGADEVLQLGELLGTSMADRTLLPDGRSHVIGHFAGVRIAEARVVSASLVGHRLADLGLRSRIGVGVIGVWVHGQFTIADPNTVLDESTVLILAGTEDQLAQYDTQYGTGSQHVGDAVIIGGGRVGRAASRAFDAAGTPHRIVEERSERALDHRYVVGDAADLEVLTTAGITTATVALITTHDDDVNIYLAIYIRRLRPDVRIVARANLDRNVSTLYRAGADSVLSYASTAAAAIWNHFRGNDTLVVAEGLDVFRARVPATMRGKTLAASQMRATTGCNVVAIDVDGTLVGNPAGDVVLQPGADLILIGDADAQQRLAELDQGWQARLRRRRTQPTS